MSELEKEHKEKECPISAIKLSENIYLQNGMKGSNVILRTIGEKMLFVPDCYPSKTRVPVEGIAIICDSLVIKMVSILMT